MNEEINQYGHIKNDDEGYPLAAWIWGHRLRIGQHWMEYLLEFLNVLAGFEYEIGRGINRGENGNTLGESYKCFTRLGLRRFVFYDNKEKTRHPDDDTASRLLQEQLERLDVIRAVDTSQGPLDLSRVLLRSLSAVEEQRSWYAKFLLPVHHNLLFWEALRKGATKYRAFGSDSDKEPHELDANIDFDPRNFFARGGEIYYLILSASTKDNMELRRSIAVNLHSLLNDHNSMIGDLANVVDSAWQEVTSNGTDTKHFTLGWIPEPDSPFYRIVAEDINTFLQARLDPLETLELLAHLIGFHLTLYIYYHANNTPSGMPADHQVKDFPATLLIDTLSGSDGGVVRRISALLYQEQEARIIQRAENYVYQYVSSSSISDPKEIDQEVRRKFGINRLRKTTREELDYKFDSLWSRYKNSQLDMAGFIELYTRDVTTLLMDDFKKNFLGVHRKLSKAVGFVAPNKGVNARYVLGDNLLKALVIANVSPDQEMIFDEFLKRLYSRYGIIIGPNEARLSGLYNRQHINSEYYEQNRKTFLEKMRYGGLAREYSDATAMVTA